MTKLETFFRDWQRLGTAYCDALTALHEAERALARKTASFERLQVAYNELCGQISNSAQLVVELNGRDEETRPLQKKLKAPMPAIPQKFQVFF